MTIISHLSHYRAESEIRPMISFQSGQLILDGQTQPIITHSDRDQIVAMFDRLAAECVGATHIVTFALGGILPMFDLRFSGNIPSDIECHIFNGLSWPGRGNGTCDFLQWLSNLPSAASLVFFDTGAKGNAIGRILNVLRTAKYGCRVLKIIGLAEVGEYAGTSTKNVRFAQKERITILPLLVDVNFFEDRVYLMGYFAQRDLGYLVEVEQFQPIQFENALVIGSQPETVLSVLRPTTTMSAALAATNTGLP